MCAFGSQGFLFAGVLEQSFAVLMLNKCFGNPGQGVKRPWFC